MEKLEKQIIKILKENSRYTISQIAKMIGENEEKVQETIKGLEENKTILKYTTVVNSEKYEDDKVEALIEVKVAPQKLKGFDALAEELCAFEEVVSLYLMSGGYDLAVMVKGNNLKDVALFVSEKLSGIDGVISCATHFLLKKYKVEGESIISGDKEEKRIIV